MANMIGYRQLGTLFLCLVFSGCATMGQHPEDPFETVNRHIFKFNDDVDKAVLKPLAEGYKTVMPQPLDQSVSNFFSNLNDVLVVTNDLFQLKFEQAASDLGRFLINSTAGLVGLVDVATAFGLHKHEEDFGQTLGYWGLESGPYLVLPFLGPSTVRDTIGQSVDFFLDPRYYYSQNQGNETQDVMFATGGLNIIDTRAGLLGAEQVVETAALDKYTYFRDAYLQRRRYLVHDGQPPGQMEEFDEEELFDDLNDDLKPQTSGAN